MTTKKATSRTPLRSRTPEDHIQYMRRRATARLVLASILFAGGGGYLITHWPQEPDAAESMARLQWTIEGDEKPAPKPQNCDSPTALERLKVAVDHFRMPAQPPAPAQTACSR